MKFIEILSDLINSYNDDERGVRDQAILCGVSNSPPPLAEHIIFSPMPHEIKQNLISNYKNTFPKELLTLYDYINGAILFWTLVDTNKGYKIPYYYFTVFGAPLTYDRLHVEPFNITIEDLGKPVGTPANWLKFATYASPENVKVEYNLFVDTQTGNVFSTELKAPKCKIVSTWNSVDDCLCSVFNMLQGTYKRNFS